VRRVRTRRRESVRTVVPTVTAGPDQSQAYCGPGHGRRWAVERGSRPPDVVQLQTAAGDCAYRLLVHPRTHRPARDHQGRYSYLPVAPAVVLGLPGVCPR
jgi:hypothetical protein